MTALTRRDMLLRSAGGLGLLVASPVFESLAADTAGSRRFKIGACDWSIRQRQNPEAFAAAKEIGLDGIEASFSEPGKENDLRDEAARAAIAVAPYTVPAARRCSRNKMTPVTV